MKKFLVALALVGAFVGVFGLTSSRVDPDLGFHLRFGQDVWAGHFSRVDEYGWGCGGCSWVNHSWGGDVLFWGLYKVGGHNAIALFSAAVIFVAFLLTHKIAKVKLSAATTVIIFVMVAAVHFVVTSRIATLAPFLFVVLWISLEKFPKKSYLHFWPLIFWTWSALHGSWILAPALVLVYLLGSWISGLWAKHDYIRALKWFVVSVLVTLINPYGIGLWQEVLAYLQNTFFKSHIQEWIPAWTYPVYVGPLLVAGVALPLAYFGIKKGKLSLPQILLFVGVFFAAAFYKRHAFYFVLIATPLLLSAYSISKLRLKAVWWFVLVGLLWWLPRPLWTADLFDDELLLARSALPFGAATFLSEHAAKGDRVFNEYSWGGYLSFAAPNTLMYADGRSAATWKTQSGHLLLEDYFEKINSSQTVWLESEGVSWILLANQASPKPNKANKWLFEGKLDQLEPQPTGLVMFLDNSKQWQKVFADQQATIWQKKKGSQLVP